MSFRGARRPFPRPPIFAVAALAFTGCYIDDPLVYEVADAGPDGTADAGSDAPGCAADTDCDDANPCTVDRCAAGACTHDPAAAGTSCGGTDLCAGASTCDGAGTCVTGAPIVVDDGNACTVDACDPATGVVTHTPTPGCTLPLPTTGAPDARRLHTAVWSGDRMIVWGGATTGSPAVTATGGRFDPVTSAWTPTSTTGAPPPRHSHCAVWTGDRMIVWGGFGASGYETTGGIYDPKADTWTPTVTAGAPAGRTGAACAWTGQELVVWGGTNGPSVLASGGRYDPVANTWKALSSTGMPSPRYNASGVWTGARVIVWGGNDLFNWHQDGASYDPVGDQWTGATPSAGAPSAREQHSALWTGARMVIWGGFTGGAYVNDGGVLDPAGGWTALATTGAPAPRTEHAAVWTGDRMIVWGGCGTDSCAQLYGDGGQWTPNVGGGSWTAIAATPDVAARRGPAAVWTGSTMLIWGGRTKQGETNTGAILYP